MKVVLALALVAVLGVASGTQLSLCQCANERVQRKPKDTGEEPATKLYNEASSERRHELVNCVKTHVNEATSQKLTEVKARLNCEDLDCVFNKVCQLNQDTHQQQANAFLSDDVKADVRAALASCQQTN